MGVKWMARDAVIRSAEILSLHLPVIPATENMLNTAVMDLMKPGVHLINTAPSEL